MKSFIKKLMSGAGQAINKSKTNVPQTEVQKKIRDLKLATQKLKGSTKKLNQTNFELQNKLPITFKKTAKKTESNTEKFKRIQKDNSKVIQGMIDKAIENKKDGGRIGRRLGGGADMAKKKTNVQKIKETFGPKTKNLKPVDKKKQKGLAKLPIEVRNKMGYAAKGGRA
jgi:chaperonin cofactor prefoldin